MRHGLLQKAKNAPHMGGGFHGPAGKQVVGSVSQKLTWGPVGNGDVFICTREGHLEALGLRSPLTFCNTFPTKRNPLLHL